MNAVVRWLLEELPKYWKTAIAVVPVVILVGNEVVQQLQVLGADGSLTGSDLFRIAVAVGAAAGVWGKANKPLNG